MVNENTTNSLGLLSKPFKLKGKKVWVAGATGMLGGATAKRLKSEYCKILTPKRSELDLLVQVLVESNRFVLDQPQVVIFHRNGKAVFARGNIQA